MTLALLATGDEIIHGDTLNTNSHYLAHALSSEGIPLGLQLTCSDKENELYDCLSFLAIKHDIILVTGGLGPTSDDRTRFALGRFLKTELIEFPEAIHHIQTRLGIGEKELTPGNRQQALFPANATVLPNPYGTALGCLCSQDNKIFILLPGPPRECLPMFNHFALPLLQKRTRSNKHLIKWRLFGVAESQIAEQIDEALRGLDCKTGYRLETPYVECKVRCKGPLLSTVKQIVDSIAAPYLIATPEQKASELLYQTILKIKCPLSIIDEATGGVLQTLIQQPNSYTWLKFYPDKKSILHFHLQGLDEYWSGQGKKGKTQVSIDYRNTETNGKETHEIPYRSPLVVHYAAEWLSFRLAHLINQLHQ